MSERYYWVYLPDIDEAGCVVTAESFEDAFAKGRDMLEPDGECKVQVHELGASQEFYIPEDDDE
jgi:hypothetical protein